MKEIKRDFYLNKLIERKENGSLKVITGATCCGKSYLLFTLYYNYLRSLGVAADHIVCIPLDNIDFEAQCDRRELLHYIKDKISGDGTYYIFLDEIQFCKGFESVLSALLHRINLDIYVTSSNSKFLSSDVITESRGHGDEIRVHPLSFSEYMSIQTVSREDAWNTYCAFGGFPLVCKQDTIESKKQHINHLLEDIHLKEIIEKNKLQSVSAVAKFVDIVAFNVGSMTNSTKIAKAVQSNGFKMSPGSVNTYLKYLKNAFLLDSSDRYDVGNKKFIFTTKKYYFADSGFRNARLNFAQSDESNIMENIIYNELKIRGYAIDIGTIDLSEKGEDGNKIPKLLPIDFVCNLGSRRYYIQSALTILTPEKQEEEECPLLNIGDNFKKIIITRDQTTPHYTNDGIYILNVLDFLLKSDSLEQ
ncbi:MAG: ATP-binding protein [Christensenellaceae bacterium]|jgi:predicted AAA+ superfamily ATPase|nr:ATP-binding protein [Christensenellaceae bacterium]